MGNLGFNLLIIVVSLAVMSCSDKPNLAHQEEATTDPISEIQDLAPANEIKPSLISEKKFCATNKVSHIRYKHDLVLHEARQNVLEYSCEGNFLGQKVITLKESRQQVSMPKFRSEFKYYKPELILVSHNTCDKVIVSGNKSLQAKVGVDYKQNTPDLQVEEGENIIQYQLSICLDPSAEICPERIVAEAGTLVLRVEFKKELLPNSQKKYQSCNLAY